MHSTFHKEAVDSHLIPSLNKPEAQILWIGCSDSGWAETQTLDLLPEEIIVHRSLGDIVSNHDLSTQSALDYALQVLKVNHIIICGHYECRMVNTHVHESPMCEWLHDVDALYSAHKTELDSLPPSQRDRRLVELHVWAQTQALLDRPEIIKAQASRGLQVHGFVYDGNRDTCVDLVEGLRYPSLL